jgi:hypothetical protein
MKYRYLCVYVGTQDETFGNGCSIYKVFGKKEGKNNKKRKKEK